jgi:sialic acid synthase SpsE
MVRAVRSAELARGAGVKEPDPHETELRSFAVRTIQATRDIGVGESLVEGGNIAVLRPGKRARGMHPRFLEALRGRRAARAIVAGDGIGESDVDPPLEAL